MIDSQTLLPCGRKKPLAQPGPSEEQLLAYHQQLKQFLTSKNLKYTHQRWQIARSILKTAGHLDAGQIVEKVKSEDASIGAATVYRSIKVLVEAGLLSESHQSIDGRVLFERPDSEHHDHIVCLDCGEIFEFHNSEIEELQNQIAKENSFSLQDHRHVIRAQCSFFHSK